MIIKPFSSLLLGEWFKYTDGDRIYAKIDKNRISVMGSSNKSEPWHSVLIQEVFSFAEDEDGLNDDVVVVSALPTMRADEKIDPVSPSFDIIKALDKAKDDFADGRNFGIHASSNVDGSYNLHVRIALGQDKNGHSKVVAGDIRVRGMESSRAVWDRYTAYLRQLRSYYKAEL